jgi:virginiamycin B lyase
MRLYLLALAILPASLRAQEPTLDITEWTVPWPDSRPRDPAVAPDGRVWFVGQAGNYIAVLDPAMGNFVRYEVDPGTFPHTVQVAKDGKIWYTGNQNGMIGRLDPATREIKRFPMPDRSLGDPHSMVFDARGDIWFTVQAGNAVGHLKTATGQFHIVPMPLANSRPYGIALDSKGNPWFDEFGANRIGTIDAATFRLREYSVPDAAARPRRIVIAPDDRIYAGDYARGKLLRLDPVSGRFTEWNNPAGANSGPYAMSGDDQGRVWLVETGPQPNRFVAFEPKMEKFDTPIPVVKSGGLVIRNMSFDPKTKTIWFGTDANTIGRAIVGSGAAVGHP